MIGRLSPFGSCRGIHTKNRETIGERDTAKEDDPGSREQPITPTDQELHLHTQVVCTLDGRPKEGGVSGWNGRRHGNGVPEHHGVAWDTSGAGLTLVQPADCFLAALDSFFFLVETKKAAMRHLLTALVTPTTNYSREMRDTHHPIPVRHL